jgi:D-alanine transaminase
VFVVSRGVMLAPPQNHLVLPGITYDVVLELARAGQVPHEVREVSEQEVRGAEEIWITSSTKEVLAVTRLDGKPVGNGKPGAVFRVVHQAYQDFKRSTMRQAA